jgi:hypothetical protein
MKQLTVRYSLRGPVLGKTVAQGASRAWDGPLTAYGVDEETALAKLQEEIRREVGEEVQLILKPSTKVAPRRTALGVRFSRYENVLGWQVAAATSPSWRGILRGYGSTRLEARTDLEDNIRREIPGDYKIHWIEEEHEEGPAL